MRQRLLSQPNFLLDVKLFFDVMTPVYITGQTLKALSLAFPFLYLPGVGLVEIAGGVLTVTFLTDVSIGHSLWFPNDMKSYLGSHHMILRTAFEGHSPSPLGLALDPAPIVHINSFIDKDSNTIAISYAEPLDLSRGVGKIVPVDSSTFGTTEVHKILSPKISLAVKKVEDYPTELHCTLNDFLPNKIKEHANGAKLEVSVNFWPFVSVVDNPAFRFDDYGRFVINSSSMQGNFNVFEGPNIIIFRSRNYVGRESYQVLYFIINTLNLFFTPISPEINSAINPDVQQLIIKGEAGVPSYVQLDASSCTLALYRLLPDGSKTYIPVDTFTLATKAGTIDTGAGPVNANIWNLEYHPDTSCFTREGEYAVEIKAKDTTGHQAVTSYSFFIDKTPPTVKIEQPEKPLSPAIPNYSVKYTLGDSIAIFCRDIICRVNSATTTIYAETSSYKSTGENYFNWDGKNSAGETVPDGVYNLVISAQDQADNEGAETIVLTVDLAPPVITNTAFNPTISTLSSDTLTLTCKSNETATIVISIIRDSDHFFI